MDDRYQPPRAPVSDGPSLEPHFDLWSIALVMTLLAMWRLDYPHANISSFIGQHFPWPVARSLRWPAAILERTLIEAVVCIPTALVLTLRLRRGAMIVAVLLSIIFCARLAPDLSVTVVGSARWRFLLVIGATHTALLVGATAFFSYLTRRAHATV